MKKAILSLGAMLVFSIASAQTPPVTPGTTAQKQTGTTTTTDVTTQTNSDSQIKIDDAIDKITVDPVDGTQSRKDKVITNDHVKSTSAPKTGKDSTSVKRTNKSKRVKQGI
jgi:hypothetical protein